MTTTYRPGPVEPDCVEFVNLAHQLLDADESTWDRKIHAHLASCPPCEVYLRQLEDLRTLLRSLGPALPADDPRLLTALKALENRPNPTTAHRSTS